MRSDKIFIDNTIDFNHEIFIRLSADLSVVKKLICPPIILSFH